MFAGSLLCSFQFNFSFICYKSRTLVFYFFQFLLFLYHSWAPSILLLSIFSCYIFIFVFSYRACEYLLPGIFLEMCYNFTNHRWLYSRFVILLSSRFSSCIMSFEFVFSICAIIYIPFFLYTSLFSSSVLNHFICTLFCASTVCLHSNQLFLLSSCVLPISFSSILSHCSSISFFFKCQISPSSFSCFSLLLYFLSLFRPCYLYCTWQLQEIWITTCLHVLRYYQNFKVFPQLFLLSCIVILLSRLGHHLRFLSGQWSLPLLSTYSLGCFFSTMAKSLLSWSMVSLKSDSYT